MADALSSSASAFSRDDDPEFVRAAAPSTLKMVEILLEEAPGHPGLLMTACSGFTQYSYAFLQAEADVRPAGSTAQPDLERRATAMYRRARGYCVRALEVRHRGSAQSLAADPKPLLAAARAADVPALYWTAVAWGGELSLAGAPILRLQELAAVRMMLSRALELDEGWNHGALHEAFITLDALPLLLGGNTARARAHFDRAVAIANGKSAFAYVTMAESVALRAGDRGEFERLLRTALAIEGAPPALTLANLVARKRAALLLGRLDRLFPAP